MPGRRSTLPRVIALAAADPGAASTIPLEIWAFTILTLTAGIATALKGRYGWLAVGLFLLGLPWLVSTFLLARPRSAWATTLYGPEKLSKAERRASRRLGRVRTQLVRRPPMRTYVRALGESRGRTGGTGAAPGLPGRRRPPFRRPGGPRHPVLRSPRQIGPEPRPEAVADAVPVDDQPVSGLLPCLYLLRLGRHGGPHGGRKDPRAASHLGRATRSTAPCAAVRYRRYVPHAWCSTTGWSASPRTGVTLENGTELITSADHRFLTGRGWKHVIGAEQGAAATAAPDAEQQADGHGCVRRVTSRTR